MLKDTQIKSLKPRGILEKKKNKDTGKMENVYTYDPKHSDLFKPYAVADGDGLSLVVNPNGSKKWRFRYRMKGPNGLIEKTLSLGSYPEVGAKEARERLREVRELVSNGIDPSKERQKEKIQPTGDILFRDVVKEYLHSREGNVSHHHYERSESLLRLYATPKFGSIPVADITHKDIKPVIVALSESNKKSSAKKLFGVLKQVLEYAEMKDYVDVNVCNLLKTSTMIKDHKVRHHASIKKPADIKKLMKNIKKYDGHFSTKLALEFMAYTALRSYNVRSAKWSQIEGKEMFIEAEEMKNGEEFRLPLSKQALRVLKEIKPLTGHGTYIFPSIRADRPMSENALLAMVRNMGYTKDQFTPHGFRSMFSTIANDKGHFNREVIDAQLSHKVGDTTSRSYNSADYVKKRRDLVQWWADWLEAL